MSASEQEVVLQQMDKESETEQEVVLQQIDKQSASEQEVVLQQIDKESASEQEVVLQQMDKESSLLLQTSDGEMSVAKIPAKKGQKKQKKERAQSAVAGGRSKKTTAKSNAISLNNMGTISIDGPGGAPEIITPVVQEPVQIKALPMPLQDQRDLEEKLVELDHLRTLNIEVSRERQLTTNMESDFALLRKQLTRADEKYKDQEKVRGEQAETITLLEQNRGEQASHITQLESVREVQKMKIDFLTREITELKADNKATLARADGLQREVQACTDYILQLEQRCFQTNQTSLDLLQTLRERLETLQSREEDIEQLKEDLRTSKENHKDDVANLKEINEKLKAHYQVETEKLQEYYLSETARLNVELKGYQEDFSV